MYKGQALSFAEAEAVFALLRTLAARGVLILYITHRLGELRQLAGTITALRDGVCGGSFPAAEVTPAQMVNMMFGEDVKLTRMLDHEPGQRTVPVSYTHLRAHETVLDVVCRLLLVNKQH